MKFNKLGNTDIDISLICLGTMTWGEQNTQDEAFEQMDMALEHASVALDHLGGGFARADPDGARDVGGAIGILAARIDVVDRGRRDRDIAVLVHLVVRQRGMRAGGADRVEGAIAQNAALLAEFEQLGGSGQRVDVAARRLDL